MIDKGLKVITESSVITDSDLNKLIAISAELTQTFETVQIFRTETEMHVSVLQDIKHPTADAKYWQAVREQNMMFQQLVAASYAYRKVIVEIKKLKRQMEQEEDLLEKELCAINIEEKQFNCVLMKQTARDRIREIMQWSTIKTSLLPLLVYGDKDVNAHQLDSYSVRFAREASMVNEHTPPADSANLVGKAQTIKRFKG